MSPPREPSYYAATLRRETDFPALEGEIDADVAIVGGGFTGVAAAVELAERGRRVVLVEAKKVGWGATGRNGGQVTGSLSGDAAMTRQLSRTLGSEAEAFVWDLRWRGHAIIESRVARYGIACDLKHGHMQAALKPAHLTDLRAMQAEGEARGMGADLTFVAKADMPGWLDTDRYLGGLVNRRNMHLHSLDLAIGEATAAASLGARIFEGTSITAIEHGARPALRTPRGRVTADAVLLAGNAYHRLERGRMAGLLFPAALANMATEPLPEDLARAINPRDIAVYDCRFVLDYYRLTADRRLMFGGGANYTGRAPADVAAALRPAMEATFPQLRGVGIGFGWSCMAGIVPNRIPQIGRLAPNVYYAQGYSGHGIATSHVLAEMVAEAITGTQDRFDTMASLRHLRLPVGDTLGGWALTLGAWYYRLRETLR
jgi:glycine/D-amino acid oxidase-like deaminating enzyme